MCRFNFFALLLLALAGCGGDSSGDALYNANSKIVFPGISSSSVAEGETAVSIRPNIVITFTEEMDRISVEQNLKFERAGYGPVSNVAKNWFDNDRTLAISAGSDLELNNIYLLEISADAKSKAGYRMQSGFSTYFTTSHVDNVPPEVIGTNPENGAVNVSGGQNIVVYFSKDMNKAATEAAFTLNDSAGQSVSGTFSWAGSNMIFTPGGKLAPFGKYSINIADSAADFMGNRLSSTFQLIYSVLGRFIFNRRIELEGNYPLKSPSNSCTYIKNNELYVFVSDTGNSRIVKYKKNPNTNVDSYIYVSEWGRYGSGESEFNNNLGIAADHNGNIYVCDTNNHRIQKFDFNGNYIAWFGKGNLTTGWHYAGSNEYVNHSNPLSAGTFHFPTSIALDLNGYFYIIDTTCTSPTGWSAVYIDENFRIQKFDNNGNFIKSWGSIGSILTGHTTPYRHHLFIDTYGAIYVSARNKSTTPSYTTITNIFHQYNFEGELIADITPLYSQLGSIPFGSPHGITADSTGNIYLATGGVYTNQGTQNYLSIIKYDTSGNILKTYLRTTGLTAYVECGFTIDSDGYLYLSDPLYNQIIKFNSNLETIYKWGSSYTGILDFSNPVSITVDSNNNLYVADDYDWDRSFIYKFNNKGDFILKWNNVGSIQENTIARVILSIRNNPSGNIFASSTWQNKLKKYTNDGTLLNAWFKDGTQQGELYNVSCIAFDSDENYYLADSGNNMIKKFNSENTLINNWGGVGTDDGLFNYPMGIIIVKSEFIFVTDTKNHRIQKFDLNGNFISKWGTKGSGDGQFQNPQRLCSDSLNRIYVTDTDNNRIQVFDINGNFLYKYGEEGSEDGQFRNLVDICVDSNFNLYTADKATKKIQMFTIISD